MKNKAVLFARVSTREQAEEGYSLSAQEKLLSDYAAQRELSLTKKFSVPESASGKQERKLFNQMVEYTINQPEVKIILCEKVDRITRNLKDAVKLQDWLNEDEERQIHFVKQGLVVHKNSRSNDQFMWDMFLVLARQYSNNLSEETKKGLYEKAAQGWYPGNNKRGYKTIGEIGRKVWLIDKDTNEHKFIYKAFQAYDTGNYSLRTVAKLLFDEGWKNSKNKQISTNEMHILLTDPFYYGDFTFNGRLYRGKHEPIISKELFDRVQERLTRKIKAGKYKKRKFIFGSGLFVCGECGRAITAEVQKGHVYYHCTRHKSACTQRRYYREELIAKHVLDSLDKFIIKDRDVFEWVRNGLKEIHENESDYHFSVVDELEKNKFEAEQRYDKLYRDRTDEKVSKEFYERNSIKYEAEINYLVDIIAKHTQANIDYHKLGMNIFELSQKGRKIYENKATMEEKRELLFFVFSNFELRNGKVTPKPHNGFQLVANRAKDGNWLRDMDSNHDTNFQRVVSYH